jgi:hypothetical protein
MDDEQADGKLPPRTPLNEPDDSRKVDESKALSIVNNTKLERVSDILLTQEQAQARAIVLQAELRIEESRHRRHAEDVKAEQEHELALIRERRATDQALFRQTIAKRKQAADITISVASLAAGIGMATLGHVVMGNFLAGAGLTFTAWNFVRS